MVTNGRKTKKRERKKPPKAFVIVVKRMHAIYYRPRRDSTTLVGKVYRIGIFPIPCTPSIWGPNPFATPLLFINRSRNMMMSQRRKSPPRDNSESKARHGLGGGVNGAGIVSLSFSRGMRKQAPRRKHGHKFVIAPGGGGLCGKWIENGTKSNFRNSKAALGNPVLPSVRHHTPSGTPLEY